MKNSVIWRMRLRLIENTLYFIVLFFYSNFVLKNRTMNELGLLKELGLDLMLVVLLCLFIFLVYTVFRYSDPINRLNYDMYRCIIAIHIIEYIVLWVIVMNFRYRTDIEAIYYSSLFGATVATTLLHSIIIFKYKSMTNEKRQQMFLSYQLPIDNVRMQMGLSRKYIDWKLLVYICISVVAFP